jgi:D-proline reductase (dithiol) PrdB
VREDGADAAIMVPNCPVCHQTVSLAARALERAGIATLVMGSAKDIVEYVGVPRFLFSDFPLGNSAGRPKDEASQDFTLELALKLLTGAPAARTTVQSPLRWSSSSEWKLDYSNIARLSPEEIAKRRAAFDAQKTIAKQLRAKT